MYKKITLHILLFFCVTNIQLLLTGDGQESRLSFDHITATGDGLFALIQAGNARMPTQHDQPPTSQQEQETENWKQTTKQLITINEKLIEIQDENMTTIETLSQQKNRWQKQSHHWKYSYFQLKRNIIYGLSASMLAAGAAYSLFEAYYQSDQQ